MKQLQHIFAEHKLDSAVPSGKSNHMNDLYNQLDENVAAYLDNILKVLQSAVKTICLYVDALAKDPKLVAFMETASKDDVSETFVTHLLELLTPNGPATAFARGFLHFAMKNKAYNHMCKLWGEEIDPDARVEKVAALRLAYSMVF